MAAKQREEAVARDKSASELHPIKTPSPRYPIAAEQSGQEGLVLVELTVATNGTVSAVHVVKAEPAAVFDDAAMAAVKRWRFQPVPIWDGRGVGKGCVSECGSRGWPDH